MRITSILTGGELRFESEIRGHRIVVDLPEAKGGANEGPMPPELLVTSLGTCVGVYAVNFCKKHGISTNGMVIHSDWDTADAPRRIGQVHITVELPAGIPPEKYDAFMKTIQQCMVHNTFCVTPDIKLKLAEPQATGCCCCG